MTNVIKSSRHAHTRRNTLGSLWEGVNDGQSMKYIQLDDVKKWDGILQQNIFNEEKALQLLCDFAISGVYSTQFVSLGY